MASSIHSEKLSQTSSSEFSKLINSLFVSVVGAKEFNGVLWMNLNVDAHMGKCREGVIKKSPYPPPGKISKNVNKISINIQDILIGRPPLKLFTLS